MDNINLSTIRYVYVMGRKMLVLPDGRLKKIRRGDGRPFNSGQYGEPTQRVSVPISLIPELRQKMLDLSNIVAKRRILESNPLFTTEGYTYEDFFRAE